MSSLNKVQLIGNLGRDPESRTFSSGGKVVEMRIATAERWTDRQSGERRERTEWHSVKVFSEGLCGVAERYLRKGSKVYVEGKLTTRKWQDQQGQDRYSTEVHLQGYDAKLILLDHRAGEGSSDGAGASGGGTPHGATGGARPAFDSDLDDDVPF
ncbi:single-stranded DNA-binding protein [Sphingomonas sp. ID0503]|uniref:single-stranded DNA-binding protein n=1 Tax=Sphingomonas sp. ID0503 TaxID=3399691 RepID=UPI003AFA1A8B